MPVQQQLVMSALEAKLHAIGGYDSILWKVRTGYLVVLYGGLTLLLGTSEWPAHAAVDAAPGRELPVLLLVFGFSVSAFLVDFSYQRKKLRVIVARDRLVDLAFLEDDHDKALLMQLLHITGEMPVESLDADMAKEYVARRNWNLAAVLAPLYGVAPLLSLVILLIGGLQL